MRGIDRRLAKSQRLDSSVNIERYSRSEEHLNAATHAVAAFVSGAGLIFLVNQAEGMGRSGSLPAVIVFGCSLILLFSFSALHHAIWEPRSKQILLALDHCGIYLLIAGTYTPFCLLLSPGREWALLAIIWSFAAGGIALQMAAFLTRNGDRYEKLAFAIYLGMGWVPLLSFSGELFGALAPWGLGLLVAGGLSYSIGVVFYVWKRLAYGHAIWHLFVVAGSTFHFFSIYYHVVPEHVR